jgi:hypothetical protein
MPISMAGSPTKLPCGDAPTTFEFCIMLPQTGAPRGKRWERSLYLHARFGTTGYVVAVLWQAV